MTNNSTKSPGVLVASGFKLSANQVTNAAGSAIVNSGTLVSSVQISNSGNIQNPGTINGGVANLAGGVLGTFGVLTGGITNDGTVNALGVVTGAVVNNSVFNVINPLSGDDNSAFTNNTAGQLNVTGGNYTALTALTNFGTITIADGRTLAAGTIDNKAGTIGLGVGSTLQGTGNSINNSATIDVATDGNIVDAGKISNLASGVINFNGPGGTATLKSGLNVIENAGQINIVSGGLEVTGDVSNVGAGALNLKAGAGLVTLFNGLTNGGAGVVDVQGGTLQVNGVLSNLSTAAPGVNVGASGSIIADEFSNGFGATLENAGIITLIKWPLQNGGVNRQHRHDQRRRR